MKPGQKKQLDRMLRQRRLLIALRTCIFLVPLILGVLWWFDPPIQHSTASGTLVAVRHVESIYGGSRRFLVELGPNHVVVARVAKHLVFEHRKEVTVRLYEGMVFGSRSYRVVAYEEG